jgi:hypothetical protein
MSSSRSRASPALQTRPHRAIDRQLYVSAPDVFAAITFIIFLTAALTLPKQHEPWGLRISHAQFPALISAVMR